MSARSRAAPWFGPRRAVPGFGEQIAHWLTEHPELRSVWMPDAWANLRYRYGGIVEIKPDPPTSVE